MAVTVSVDYAMKSRDVSARFTKKVWYNAIRKSVLEKLFGTSGIKMHKPTEVFAKNQKIVVDHYVILKVSLGNFSFRANFFVSDELVDLVDKNVDLVIGKETIDKEHIRVLE